MASKARKERIRKMIPLRRMGAGGGKNKERVYGPKSGVPRFGYPGVGRRRTGPTTPPNAIGGSKGPLPPTGHEIQPLKYGGGGGERFHLPPGFSRTRTDRYTRHQAKQAEKKARRLGARSGLA